MRWRLGKAALIGATTFAVICSGWSINAAGPQVPKAHVDTTYNLPTGGTTYRVNAGDNLQAALDAAQPGDIIELQAGATFTGNYVLHPKTGNGWVYITSSQLAQLPPEGTRVAPEDAVHMPRIICPNQFNPALIVEQGVQNYRFVGVEITTAYTERTGVQYGVVRVGWGGTSEQPAEGIIFDRCYIHGTTEGNIRDGIVSYNVKNWAIIDSHVSEFHGVGYESHAIHVYNTPGPTKIANNYVQGAGINIFIGDSDLGGGSIPQDIEIVGNHLHKPWSWKPDHPDYAGISWLVKNLLEIKAAQRVLIDGNILENVWVGAQHGQVFVVTPRADKIEDVTIRRNVCRNFEGGMNINSANASLDRVLVEDNLFYGLNKSTAYFITIAGTPGQLHDIFIKHNTMIATANYGWIMFNGSSEAEVQGIVVSDNLVTHGTYGIIGNGKGVGLKPVQWYCTGFDIRSNALIGGTASWYKESAAFRDFHFPADNTSVGFTDVSLDEISDFRLLASSPYRSAERNEKSLGANIDLIVSATQRVSAP